MLKAGGRILKSQSTRLTQRLRGDDMTALQVAKILMCDHATLPTLYGDKNVKGVAAIIEENLTREVVISMEDGVVDIVSIPEGVTLKIRDYDDGRAAMKPDGIDDNGDPYCEEVHTHEQT